MKRPGRGAARAAAALLTSAALLTAPLVRADDKQACLAASEKAQQLRNEGKLSAAREELLVCGRAECPKLVQQDCTQWMSEVLQILPTIVPGAKDRRGRDLVDVKVSVDGALVAESIDGKAVPIDPGVHTLRFEAAGAPAVEEQVVVKQGEKNRIVTVTLAIGEEPASAKEGTAPASEPERSSAPIAAYVVGGLGLAALGAALYVQLDANGDARDLRETCAPRCAQSDVDDLETRYNIARVTAAVGGAALIAGVVLFILHGSGGSKASKASLPLSVHPVGAGGAGATIRF